VVAAAVDGAIAAAVEDSAALEAEALVAVAQAGLGKMNYNMIFNNKRASNWRLFLVKSLDDLNDPSIFKFTFFFNYIFGNTALTIATNSVSPFCFLALIISPSILKLK
jgi:hypothetical protein